jgi:hypothetical protein
MIPIKAYLWMPVFIEVLVLLVPFRRFMASPAASFPANSDFFSGFFGPSAPIFHPIPQPYEAWHFLRLYGDAGDDNHEPRGQYLPTM